MVNALNPTEKEGCNIKTTKKSDKERPSKRVKRLTAGEDNEKRYRATFDKSQIYQMERVFLLNHYPDVAARSDLSSSTGLSEAQVQVSTEFCKLHYDNNLCYCKTKQVNTFSFRALQVATQTQESVF